MTRMWVAILMGVFMASEVQGNEVAKAKVVLEQWVETYGILRSWDVVSEMSDNAQRHRGALAYVWRRLMDLPEKERQNLYRDLGRLLDFKTPEQVLASQPIFDDYQAHFKIDVFLLWKQLLAKTTLPIPWSSAFNEAYYSQADGAGMLFDVSLPPVDEGRETYPMIVVLKGGPKVNPSAALPFIQIKPSVRGIWGYRAMSGVDVMLAIAFMKRHYPVDPDRIYLVGFSAGASGAMQLASCYPDAFAAVMPMVAVGTDYPLVNFKNLPVAMHHGTDDWVSSICNVRVQFDRMQALGCPVMLKEYPGVGHSVPKPHEPLVSWLFEHVRNSSPTLIHHTCETPTLGRSFWIDIREFQDVHRRASVEALADSVGGVVRITPENVQRMALDFDHIPGRDKIKTVEIGADQLRVDSSVQNFVCQFQDGRWQMVSDVQTDPLAKRPYLAGAAANLYQGEPLVVVYGTGSGETGRVDQLRQAAEKLASYGGPTRPPMPDSFPVVADTALTPEQEANCNVILLGKPEENSVSRANMAELPIVIAHDTLIAGDRPALPLVDQVVSMIYPHPKYPKRLMYLIAPFTDQNGLLRFGEGPQHFLVGPEGFDRVSQADLAVMNLEREIGRHMQFGKGWDWILTRGSDQTIPDHFGDRSGLAMAYLSVMQQKSGADFALWWGPEDKGMWGGYDFNFLQSYNSDFYTLADFRTQNRLIETIVGGVSGTELKEIWQRWGLNRELLCVPEIQIDALRDQEHYRIHIPMDLYIKLSQRKKALVQPKPGPLISSDEVMAEVFQ